MTFAIRIENWKLPYVHTENFFRAKREVDCNRVDKDRIVWRECFVYNIELNLVFDTTQTA